MVVVQLAALVTIYLAWNVGVQSMGTIIGITLGSGIMSLRGATIFSGIFAILGAYLYAPKIVETIGEGLVHFDMIGVMVVMLTGGFLATVFAWKKIPTSITYVVIGGIGGYSLGAHVPFNIKLFGIIMGSLFASPVIAVILSYLIYKGLHIITLDRITSAPARELLETRFYIPMLISLIILSIALGADAIGVAISILQGQFSTFNLFLFGIGGMILGLVTWSYRIARTTGIGITELSPTRGFSANLGSGIVAISFLYFSIPVSITQTLIGAIVGVGLARGRVEQKTIREILKFWIIGLPSAFIINYIIGYMVYLFV